MTIWYARLEAPRSLTHQHNEAYDGWKTGGYPSFSLATRRHLDRTITCSYYLRQWLIDRGYDGDRIAVVKLGMDRNAFGAPTASEKSAAKSTLLGLDSETPVVMSVARLDRQKRSTILPDILARTREILRDGGSNLSPVLFMLGDGDLRPQVESRIRALGLDKNGTVRLLGAVTDPATYLRAADVFLLPSMSEGVSVAVSEGPHPAIAPTDSSAMSVGLPILTARAGALPEQVGARTSTDPQQYSGILVDHTLVDVQDIELYAQKLAEILLQKALRQRLASNSLRLVRTLPDFADWRVSLQGLFTEIEQAGPWPAHALAKLPHSASYFALQSLLERACPTSRCCH